MVHSSWRNRWRREISPFSDENVIQQAEVLAARRGTSVSTLVAAELERLVADDDRYEAAFGAPDAPSPVQHAAEGAGGVEMTSMSGNGADIRRYQRARLRSRRVRRASQPVAAALLDDLWRTRSGVLSTQVLAEFYAVVTRKFHPPLPWREARALVDAYAAWRVAQVDPPLIVAASALQEKVSLSFCDALIVEAARRAGADRLVSQDLQHGRRIAGLAIENPFASVDS